MQISWRRLGRAIGIAIVASAAAGGAAVGANELWRHATTSKELAIAAIEISGLQRAEEHAVRVLSGVNEGHNLVELDPDEVAARVGRHPWIADVEVRREFPRTLAIDVVEHVPVVLVALEHLYYANGEGEIVKRWAPGERELLPVVTGLDRGQIESGQGTARADLRSAIGFLGDVRAALGDAAPAIEEVHVDPVLGLSFAVAGESARVLAGKAPWRDRIAQWARVRDELKKRGLQAEAVTFAGERRPERVVARLAVVKPETK